MEADGQHAMEPIMQQSAMMANWLSVVSDGNVSTSEVVDGHRWISAGRLVDGHSLCCVQDGENDRPTIPSIDGCRRHMMMGGVTEITQQSREPNFAAEVQ
jgi:hypothetical protein